MTEQVNNLPLWWNAKKSEVHKDIFDVVTHLHRSQTERMEKNLRALSLYGNSDLLAQTPYTYTKLATPQLPENRVKYNIISSTSDTVCAKISKMNARVEFLTNGGDWRLKKQSKQLSKFTEGLFYHNEIHKLHQAGFRDSTIFDVGAIKHYIDADHKEIRSERVLPIELYVDLADALYGHPTHMYQVKYFHREVLQSMYPKYKSDIKASAESFDRTLYKANELADYVAVIESWKIPTGKDTEGRHCVTIEKATLEDEPYTKRYFPFTFFHWSKPITGFWGQSLAERLQGNQIEINKMLRTIQKSFHLGSAFKVFLEYGSRVAKEHLNNEIGSIVYYAGSKPEFYVPQTVHPEFFKHLEWLIEKGYEEAGISVSSATSQKPAGLESAVAIREYNDIETERFAIISQNYEHSFLKTAKIYLDLAREMHDAGMDLKVTAESKKFIESIKWSQIELQENDYIMKMFPVSMLPHEPAGRLAFVQDLMNSGLIPQQYALNLLDFPDLEQFVSRETAAVDDIQKTIDSIMEKGIDGFTNPEPFQNLDIGVQMMHSSYLEAKNNDVPEDRLELMRNWIAMAEKLKAMGTAPAQAAPQPEQAQPQQQAPMPGGPALPQQGPQGPQ